jgi:hypothetical protein
MHQGGKEVLRRGHARGQSREAPGSTRVLRGSSRSASCATETWQDGQWKSCRRGENLDAKFGAAFDPVPARRVRLSMTEAPDTPTIWESQLFK